ncbi:hypothetical protein V6N13_007198 [Hibiscus sabdariffa]
MCGLEAPRCRRQAHHRREERPLGCYSRTPCADSRPLGAGSKHTVGGRKFPLGAGGKHTIGGGRPPRVLYSRTPCADSRPLCAGGRPPRVLQPHTMCGLKAPSGATPAHHVRTQGPSVREASTPCACSRALGVGGMHTICGRKGAPLVLLPHTMWGKEALGWPPSGC